MYSTQLRNIKMEVLNAENSTGGQETKQAKARMDLTRNEHDRKNDVNETIGTPAGIQLDARSIHWDKGKWLPENA